MKPDLDTQRELSRNGELRMMVESPGWDVARRMLTDYIWDLRDVQSIKAKGLTSATAIQRHIEANDTAISILWDWVKLVEGSVDVHKETQQMLQDRKEESYIIRNE